MLAIKTIDSEEIVSTPIKQDPNFEIEYPLYKIGELVAQEENLANQGVVSGLKLVDGTWNYLIQLSIDGSETEVWIPQASVIPLDSSQMLYKDRWFISAKLWGEEFLYEVFDRETEATATGLRLLPTRIDALIEGKKFVQREMGLE